MRRSYLVILLLLFTFISCEEIINEENLENDQVNVLAPLNDTQLPAGEIFFDWETVNGASDYTIQIAKPDFNQTEQLLLQQTDSTTNASLNMTTGSYQWRVRAENSAFNSPYTIISFTVQ